MKENGDLPKLRMAPRETIEETAHRLERQQRAEQLERETHLEKSLGPFRVGSVRYLNAVPLTRGLEEEVTFATPAELGRMLDRDELDAALVSVTEVLLKEKYDVLDGIAGSPRLAGEIPAKVQILRNTRPHRPVR